MGEYTRILAKDVNCPTTSSKELLQCLRTKDVKEILDSKLKMGLPVVRILYLMHRFFFILNLILPSDLN